MLFEQLQGALIEEDESLEFVSNFLMFFEVDKLVAEASEECLKRRKSSELLAVNILANVNDILL